VQSAAVSFQPYITLNGTPPQLHTPRHTQSQTNQITNRLTNKQAT
jgi:hypothetical protein